MYPAPDDLKKFPACCKTSVSLLAQADQLPPHVRFVLTSRKDARMEDNFRNASGLFISAAEFDEFNWRDVSQFVAEQIKTQAGFAPAVSKLHPKEIEKIVVTITQKAAGNFQYVSHLLSDRVRIVDEYLACIPFCSKTLSY